MATTTNEQLVSIPDAVKGDCHFVLKEGERIGFCFPVHGWKLQPIIKRFISKLTIERPNATSQPYVYTLSTCGDSCGETMEQIYEALKDKGLEPKAQCSLIMPESYIGLPFMYTDTDLREAEKKSLSAMELRKFAEIVLYRRGITMPFNRGYLPKVYSRVFGPFFHKHLVTDKRFRVDTDKCIGCGKCVKACPVDNLKIESGHPVWLHNGDCLTCFACYHYCPERAIDFWHFTKGKGQYYYDHNKKKQK